MGTRTFVVERMTKRPTPRSAGMFSHGGKTQQAKGFRRIDPAALGQVQPAAPDTAQRERDTGKTAKATKMTATVAPLTPKT